MVQTRQVIGQGSSATFFATLKGQVSQRVECTSNFLDSTQISWSVNSVISSPFNSPECRILYR